MMGINLERKVRVNTWCQHALQSSRWQLDSIRVKCGNTERGIHRKQREKHSQNSLATVTTRLSAWEGMTLPLCLMITAPLFRGHAATTKNSPSKWSHISGSTDDTHQWFGEQQTALTVAPVKCGALHLPFSLLSLDFRLSLRLQHPERALLCHEPRFKIFML